MARRMYDELDVRCAFEAGVIDAEDTEWCNQLLKEGRQKEVNDFLDRRSKAVDDEMRMDSNEVVTGCLGLTAVIVGLLVLMACLFVGPIMQLLASFTGGK